MKRVVLLSFLVTVVLMLLFAPVLAAKAYTFKLATAWTVASGRIDPAEQPKNKYWQYVAKTYGVVPYTQGIEADGPNADYIMALRLGLTGGENYDAIDRPWDPVLLKELIDNKMLKPLDTYLKLYGKELMGRISKDQWDLVRAMAPDGKIYFIPEVINVTGTAEACLGGYIRKDWLDKLGLKLPTTKEELVNVYRAFRDKDPNGNGLKDEIPISGRLGLRFCDELFAMYGVSMCDGYPEWHWDAKKKTMICDQVSDEMKNALIFIRDLVKEGLMDQTMVTQSRADWVAKINGNRVGHYVHMTGSVGDFSAFYADDPKAEWTYLPVPLVSGLPKQHMWRFAFGNPLFCITKYAKDPGKIIKWFNAGSTLAGSRYQTCGIPGLDWIRVDDGTPEGLVKQISVDAVAPVNTHKYLLGLYNNGTSYKLASREMFTSELDYRINGVTWYNIQVGMMKDGVLIPANDGMPAEIYDGYPDYVPSGSGLKYYVEFASKFVMGEPGATWDQYVKKWYDNGGKVVVDKATAWYKKVHKIK